MSSYKFLIDGNQDGNFYIIHVTLFRSTAKENRWLKSRKKMMFTVWSDAALKEGFVLMVRSYIGSGEYRRIWS